MQARLLALALLATTPVVVHCGSSSEVAPAPPPLPAIDAGGVDASADSATALPDASPLAPPLARMATARSLFSVVTGKDGRLRAFGGLTSLGLDDGVEAYDPMANAWSQSPAHSSQARYGHAATSDATGRVFIVGGTTDGQGPIGSVDAYSPSTDTWKALADLPTPRLGLAAAAGKDGRIYTIGGRGADGAPTSAVEIYAPDTQTWSTGPSLPTRRLALVAVTGQDGKIYAIGGRDAENAPLAVVEALDTDKGTWETVQPLRTARFWFGATLAKDGRIMVLGGIGDLGFLDDLEAFTPGAGWKSLRPMPEPRAWVSAGASEDGRIFAIGGSLPPDDALPMRQRPPLRTILAFDPKTNTWTK